MQKFKLLTSSHQGTNDMTKEWAQKVPNGIKSVLQECYGVISELKQKCKLLQSQIVQKDTIINKLLQEKQDHILHLSYCQTGIIKQKLDQANKQTLEMKNNFESLLSNCEKTIAKYKGELQKLKGFNKVLRIQNNHLREELKQFNSNGRQRDKKIGKITPMKFYMQDDDNNTNTFSFTKNRFHQIQQNQTIESTTPIKFNTSKSINLSTAAKSNSKTYSKQLDKRESLKPTRQLFQNTFLKQQINPSTSLSNQSNTRNEEVTIWFGRLKKLLAESDEQS